MKAYKGAVLLGLGFCIGYQCATSRQLEMIVRDLSSVVSTAENEQNQVASPLQGDISKFSILVGQEDGVASKYAGLQNGGNSYAQNGYEKWNTQVGNQGFHLSKGLAEWNLPPGSPSPSGRSFSKTICLERVTENERAVARMFASLPDWSVIKHAKETNDPNCKNSLLSFMRTDTPKRLKEHADGEQISPRVVGVRMYKNGLHEMIKNQVRQNDDDLMLRDSTPKTREFESLTSCKEFCDNEWLKAQRQTPPQAWMWKPTSSSGGNGIEEIGDTKGGIISSPSESCHQHCAMDGGWEDFQAQEVADAMLLTDKRKFDARSYILIANVDPLVVFHGAEAIRTCAEPMNATNPPPFPGMEANSSWNKFQHVCNMGVGKQHPIDGTWSYEHNVGPLAMGIPDDAARSRVVSKLRKHNQAIVKLMRPKLQGLVGMYQLIGVDYIVDKNEKVWLLELNSSPWCPMGNWTPNPYGDILEIEWKILETYNRYHHNGTKWQAPLDQAVSELELETLARMPI